MESLPLRVNNLGSDASRQDGSAYKPSPKNKEGKKRQSDSFTKVLEKIP